MAEHVPPTAAAVASMVQQRIDALDRDGLTETTTVDWRGSTKTLPVIVMPVSSLYFNPDTHRVRAQRTLNPEKDAIVGSNPFGSEAQEYLRELLRADPREPTKDDPGFTALRDDLKDNGQTEPGVITRAGILINGNTRCAALREIGAEHIRVGVLPPDASHDDFLGVELALQLRKEF